MALIPTSNVMVYNYHDKNIKWIMAITPHEMTLITANDPCKYCIYNTMIK